MAITSHTMVVELSHKVVVLFMTWLFREATTSSLSLLSLLRIIKNLIWHCMGRLMVLMCTNVLALRTYPPYPKHACTASFSRRTCRPMPAKRGEMTRSALREPWGAMQLATWPVTRMCVLDCLANSASVHVPLRTSLTIYSLQFGKWSLFGHDLSQTLGI
jgi:hypothetical protein